MPDAAAADLERRAGSLEETVAVKRLGVIMTPSCGNRYESGGVLNPGGVRAADGSMHLFPRLIDDQGRSRIGHVRVRFERGVPVGVERLGIAREDYKDGREVSAEDARVVYIGLLDRYVMTYVVADSRSTRVAIAMSEDLVRWVSLGQLRYDGLADGVDLNACNNKDAALCCDVILDPCGVPSFGIMHRPTIAADDLGAHEDIWLSFVPVESVLHDIATLTTVRRHLRILRPAHSWELDKIGAGASGVRLPYGWLLTYHAVSTAGGVARYRMGLAIADLDRPQRIAWRTSAPALEPAMEYELKNDASGVVFPTAADLREDGQIDVYYGAADSAIAVARVTLPAAMRTRGPLELSAMDVSARTGR